MEEFKKRVQDILRLAVFIVPIPFGAFASDKPFFAPLSVLVFMLASLTLPCTVRYRQMKRRGTSDYARAGAILYGGIIVLLAAVGVLNGCMTSPMWQSYGGRTAIFAVWLIGTVAVQTAAAWGIEAWQRHLRQYWFSEFLDPLLYALPLPCAVLGMFSFPGLGETAVTSSLILGMLGILGFCFLAMCVLGIAVFAFYFFPRRDVFPRRSERLVQLARILAMTVVWIGLHHAVFNGSGRLFELFVMYCLPMTQNNPLVFVTPFLLEGVLMLVSLAASNLLVWLLERWFPASQS